MTKHDRTTERNHGTVGCPGVAPGAGIVGPDQQDAKTVLNLTDDPLPVPSARTIKR
jgi:hypothetical protein